MLSIILTKWRDINWKALAISTILQVSILFYVPIRYAQNISTSTFEYNLWIVGVYAITVAISAFLIFTSNFKSPFAILTIVASFVTAFSGIIKGNFSLFLLLLLIPIFLLIVQVGYTQLKNEFGLIIYSFLITVSVPVTIAFMSAHFLSWTFIKSLIPLFFVTVLFLTPIFIEKIGMRFSITSTLSGVILIISILTQSISLKSILAIIIILAGWFGMHNFPHMNHKYVSYSLLELLVVLLTY